MKPEPTTPAPPRESPLSRVFAGAFGAFLGLSLLKFGNPPVMEKWVTTPQGGYEIVLGYPWPIRWAYWILLLVALLGLLAARPKVRAPRWLIVLPLLWLLWEVLAGSQTMDASLTRVTLIHFTATVACFYLGCFALTRANCLTPFWLGVGGGLLIVLAVGWQQHFGGLEQTRRYFYLYIYPEIKSRLSEVPPEYLKKISSERIFSTLFYPNALAGCIILLLAPVLTVIWSLRQRLTVGARTFLVLVVGGASLACLYWSGSKGGWLLMLLLGLIALLRLPFAKPYKLTLVTLVLLFGLAGFFWKYSAFFQRGATSVSARFDYWRAALQTANAKPLFGSGPGTFGLAYSEIKRPESEPSRLVHNDYLQQASDSGWIGFLIYTLFVAAVLAWTYPRNPAGSQAYNWPVFSIWLGAFGWSLQGLFEFGLYLPALAWPGFALLGWLTNRQRNPIDKLG